MKKWLDNFGKADNANESNVSLPEDFNGLAYDTTGRNYSPAWGGQFQQGGTLPGSAGFMYARTIDPAPSNGKYAKKTKASAQNGKEMQFYQEGLDWKPKSMQNGGDQISYNDPRYPELYKNRQLGRWLDENNFDSQVPLDEIVVTGQRPSLYKDLRDLTKTVEETAAEFTGIPGTIRFSQDPMENIKGLIRTGDQTGLGLVGLLPGVEQTGFNYNAQDVEGAFNTLDAFGLASGVAGLARRPIQKGLQQVGQNLKNVRMSVPSEIAEGLQTNGIFDIFKAKSKFQSEIDWSKWNPETPTHKVLMDEYNAIEESTKKAGTWMKNPDGSPFQGTPEQFIQQQSSWFKKSYPEGYENVYRGVGQYNASPDMALSSSSNHLRGDRGIFTADEGLAKYYTNWKDNQVLTPLSDPNKGGVFDLMIPKGNQIDYNTMSSHFAEVDLIKSASKESLQKNYEMTKSHLERLRKMKDVSPETLENQAKRVEDLKRYVSEFDNVNTNLVEFEKMRSELGDLTNTDAIAEYIPKTDLRRILLRNILDGKSGDVSVINSRPGNYLKSRVGNVGFFDLNDSNIYKGLVPAGIATGLSLDQKRDGGIIVDDRGQWNHPGEITQVNSNYITMGPDPKTGKKIKHDLIGISDTGDVQYMTPGNDYKFKGSKVTEFPVAKLGINDLDAQPMKKLNQLLNFTNNPDKTNWLDKYQ